MASTVKRLRLPLLLGLLLSLVVLGWARSASAEADCDCPMPHVEGQKCCCEDGVSSDEGLSCASVATPALVVSTPAPVAPTLFLVSALGHPRVDVIAMAPPVPRLGPPPRVGPSVARPPPPRQPLFVRHRALLI